MAAIDKNYVNSWEQWKELRDWIWDREIILKNNIKIRLTDYMYYPKFGETEVNQWLDKVRKNNMKHYGQTSDAEIPFWNTPTYVDLWMIKNCPIERVQDRLKEQYGDSYEAIKNGTSIYDTYKRNGLGKNFKYKVIKRPNQHHIHHFSCINRIGQQFIYKDNKLNWWTVNLEDIKHPKFSEESVLWLANKDFNYWTCDEEALPFTSDVMDIQRKMPSLKSIIRLIKKWDLPDGTKIDFYSFRFNFGWTIIIKKK